MLSFKSFFLSINSKYHKAFVLNLGKWISLWWKYNWLKLWVCPQFKSIQILLESKKSEYEYVTLFNSHFWVMTSLSILRENQQLNTSTRYPECVRRMKHESWSQVRKNRVVARKKSNERGKDRVGQVKCDASVGLTVSRRKEFCCILCDKYEIDLIPH